MGSELSLTRSEQSGGRWRGAARDSSGVVLESGGGEKCSFLFNADLTERLGRNCLESNLLLPAVNRTQNCRAAGKDNDVLALCAFFKLREGT